MQNKKFNRYLNYTIMTSISILFVFIILLGTFIYIIKYGDRVFQIISISIFSIYILACISVFFIFFNKIFSYFIIDNEGIKIYYKKVITKSINWEEIINISKSSLFNGGWIFLIELKNDVKIEINFNKKIKDMLIINCPIKDLKEKISKL